MDVARLREEKDVLSPNEFCIAVLREVHQTLLCIGHICDLPQAATAVSSVAASERRAFCCDCVRHLWEMVMDVIHRRQEHHGEEPFWAYLNFVLEALCRGSPTEPGGDVGEELCSLLSVGKQGLRLTLGFPAGKFNLSSLACATGGDACTPAFCLWLLASVAEVDGGCMWKKKVGTHLLA
ncbi:hypothetical protein IscW_ISCW004689 [Ixodes scapularis]|uniref:C2H2-type domain-containing protein n=1 Tax=Ixodes scapularis TaxID=6945 RepID=B7PF69_IXOSC|nr:hypothetical protein IscW_ISCW004689 [Ixodes scapularis]|eukprot:XP_002433841.1 hypothetical protein IscW_ISCW004689 [Ixodes scapularis]